MKAIIISFSILIAGLVGAFIWFFVFPPTQLSSGIGNYLLADHIYNKTFDAVVSDKCQNEFLYYGLTIVSSSPNYLYEAVSKKCRNQLQEVDYQMNNKTIFRYIPNYYY